MSKLRKWEEIEEGFSRRSTDGWHLFGVVQLHSNGDQQGKANGVVFGAENIYFEPKGAFTGEVSIPMVKETGATHVILGHSERRHIFGESDELVAKKTKAALENGVDLVIELPYIYTVQNAYVFARTAVSLLNLMGISELVFGSETGNLEELRKYAELQVDVTRLKQLMHDGNSYPHSYGLLSSALYSNDILAVAYLKALKGTSITPICIRRTNDYHDVNLDVISSASAIRKAIKENKDISMATPILIKDPIFNEDLYPYLRRLLMTMDKEELSEFFLVSEGIENLLKVNAIKYDRYEDFMNASISRRYTRSRIQRVLIHIACHILKTDVNNLPELSYIRVLGFNQTGQNYLKQIKKTTSIITQFKNIPAPYKQIEWKTELLYSTLKKDPQAYIKRQLLRQKTSGKKPHPRKRYR